MAVCNLGLLYRHILGLRVTECSGVMGVATPAALNGLLCYHRCLWKRSSRQWCLRQRLLLRGERHTDPLIRLFRHSVSLVIREVLIISQDLLHLAERQPAFWCNVSFCVAFMVYQRLRQVSPTSKGNTAGATLAIVAAFWLT